MSEEGVAEMSEEVVAGGSMELYLKMELLEDGATRRYSSCCYLKILMLSRVVGAGRRWWVDRAT